MQVEALQELQKKIDDLKDRGKAHLADGDAAAETAEQTAMNYMRAMGVMEGLQAARSLIDEKLRSMHRGEN